MKCPKCHGTGEVATPPQPSLPALGNGAPQAWHASVEPVRAKLDELGAPQELYDGAYWLAIDAWLGPHPRIAYLEELAKYLVWWQAQSGSKRHRKLRRAFRNWLATCERRDADAEQRREIYRQRPIVNEYPGANRHR